MAAIHFSRASQELASCCTGFDLPSQTIYRNQLGVNSPVFGLNDIAVAAGSTVLNVVKNGVISSVAIPAAILAIVGQRNLKPIVGTDNFILTAQDSASASLLYSVFNGTALTFGTVYTVAMFASHSSHTVYADTTGILITCSRLEWVAASVSARLYSIATVGAAAVTEVSFTPTAPFIYNAAVQLIRNSSVYAVAFIANNTGSDTYKSVVYTATTLSGAYTAKSALNSSTYIDYSDATYGKETYTILSMTGITYTTTEFNLYLTNSDLTPADTDFTSGARAWLSPTKLARRLSSSPGSAYSIIEVSPTSAVVVAMGKNPNMETGIRITSSTTEELVFSTPTKITPRYLTKSAP